MSISDWDEVLQQREAIINGECFADLWHIEDIKEVADSYQEDYILSTELAKKVLARMKAMYNPDFGIYWDGVSGDIEHVIAQEENND
jgi:ABC-type cobalt transport system substrate-binding protein